MGFVGSANINGVRSTPFIFGLTQKRPESVILP